MAAETSVSAAVRGELRRLGVTGTPEGRTALRLAVALDDAGARDAPVISRELRQLLAVLRESIAVPASDPVDELRTKRERRRAG